MVYQLTSSVTALEREMSIPCMLLWSTAYFTFMFIVRYSEKIVVAFTAKSFAVVCGSFREHKSMMPRRVLLLILACLTSCRYLAGPAVHSMTHLDMELLSQLMTNCHTICRCWRSIIQLSLSLLTILRTTSMPRLDSWCHLYAFTLLFLNWTVHWEVCLDKCRFLKKLLTLTNVLMCLWCGKQTEHVWNSSDLLSCIRVNQIFWQKYIWHCSTSEKNTDQIVLKQQITDVMECCTFCKKWHIIYNL